MNNEKNSLEKIFHFSMQNRDPPNDGWRASDTILLIFHIMLFWSPPRKTWCFQQ